MTEVPIRLVDKAEVTTGTADGAGGPAEGRIELCPKNGCDYRCCEFQQGNYIVLFPGEIEAAEAAGSSLGHLRITAAEHGGYRAVCTAGDTASCDNGYKPLDCKSYPFFPTLRPDRDEVGLMIKGRKCPLLVEEVREHQAWVRAVWSALAAPSVRIATWLRRVRLVGYDLVRE